MDKNCGCWAILSCSVRNPCKNPDSRNSATSIPRSSLVYDAGMLLIYSNLALIFETLMMNFVGFCFLNHQLVKLLSNFQVCLYVDVVSAVRFSV